MAQVFAQPNSAIVTQAPHAEPEVGFVTTNILMQGAPVRLAPAVAASLSPEMLLAYLRGNLEGLDGQVRDALARMNDRRARTAELTDIANRIRGMKQEAANLSKEGKGQDNDGILLTVDKNGGQVQTPEGDAIHSMLVDAGMSEGAADQMMDRWGEHAHPDDLDAALTYVTDEIGKVNDENEYESLVLNDLISKRSQMIQMVSKMMGSMDETARAVIQNMR